MYKFLCYPFPVRIFLSEVSLDFIVVNDPALLRIYEEDSAGV